MSHIDEQRIMELALGSEPNRGEADHLEACALCAEAFASEQGLTSWLATVPQPVAPEGFLERVTDAYATELGHKTYRAPVLALGGIAAMLIPVTLLALSAWTDVLARLMSWAVAVKALGEVGFGLMRALGSPSSLGMTLVVTQVLLLLGGLGVLARLMWVTNPAGQEAVR